MRRITIGRRASLAGLAATALIPLGLVSVAPTSPAWALPSTLDLVGHGWGHGRGMGQYGALGYASQPYNWTYQQILAHFYGGTAMATTNVSSISVHLSELDGSSSVTVSAPSGGQLTIDGKPVASPATLTSGHTASVPGGDVVVSGPWSNGPTREFAGQIAFAGSEVDDVVSLDQYVEGVVPRETPASWPLAALQAQAVASRSYALAYLAAYKTSSICDSGGCQLFGGDPMQYGGGAYVSNSNQAATSTTGQVLDCTATACGTPGQVAFTEFSSSTGGYTAGGRFPAVPDDGDATSSNPNHTWNASIPTSAIQSAFPSIGTLQSVTVTGRNGDGDLGGRVLQMVLSGSAASLTISGDQFAAAMGLKSDWFAFTNVAPPGSDTGYWVVDSAGGVYPFGSAPSLGSMAGHHLNAPVIGMAPTGDGAGYWLVAGDGGIFSFGDARFYGSTGGIRLNKPVLGMASTPDSAGYWLVASDGGVFSFGDARFYGSTGGIRLTKPVVAMARTADGKGYWLVASDGGVFSFGDAAFHGSGASLRLAAPIVGMVPTADGGGYWLVASDGGVFAYGDAGFVGSLGGTGVTDVASVTPTPDDHGYLLVTRSGHVHGFGDATNFGDPATSVPGWTGSAIGIFAQGPA